MKIRNGFVSNSSSSSFCLYGISVDESEIVAALKAKGETDPMLDESIYEYLDAWSYEHKKSKGELTEEDIAKYESRFFHPDDGFEFEDVNGCYQVIGVPWNKIKDDETGAEFKARIQAKITELLGDDAKCDTQIEAWYPC
jgi:hypothetical protein